MIKNSLGLAVLLAALTPEIGELGEAGSSRDTAPAELRMWVDARAGTGETVHWIADGAVYEYPSGKKLFGLVGFDSSTVLWPKNHGDGILHLTRKTFAFTDPDTGSVLRNYNGQEVEPIAYPYQLITYRMEDGKIHGDVEQGVAPRVQQIESKEGMTVRQIGKDTLAVTASVYLDFALPSGQRIDAWENYDFFIHAESSVAEPHQLSWQRYGDLPRWAGEGKAIYHLLSWRVESVEEFPSELLDWAQSEMPMWLDAPASLEEIRAIQRGDISNSDEGWERGAGGSK